MADIELVIKIPEKTYNALTHTEFDANLVVDEMSKAIANGTPIPDNATNGDAVKTLFSDTLDNFCERTTWEWNRWWNAPYQKGGTNRKSCEYRHENGNCLKVGGFCTSVDDEHCVKGGKE